MSFDETTAARISAEYAQARLAGDVTGIDAALLALADDWEGTEASDDTIALLLRTQCHQLSIVAGKLADALDMDLESMFASISRIELPK